MKAMKHIQQARSHVLVLDRGEELISSLGAFCAVHDIRNAWLSGLGGAAEVEIGFYDPNIKDYRWQTINEPLEILSLTGNLSYVEGEPFWHIHGVFGRSNFQTIGGHVRRLTVGLTGEMHITPLESDFTRLPDDTTGLKLITPIDPAPDV
jgi:predicted DNA-binding protein with PD1-like motif